LNNYSIGEVNIESDKEKIISFLKRTIKSASFSEDYYKWRYLQAPLDKVKCWLATIDESNVTVGSSTIFPRNFLLNGKLTHVATLGDFHIDGTHRGFGPALKLQKSIIEKNRRSDLQFIYGVPTKVAMPVLKRIGYRELGRFTQFMKPLKISSLPKKYLPFFLKFSMLTNIVDSLICFIAKENRYRKKFDYLVETPDFFDERFDFFWDKASKQFNIVEERNSKFLNWRYKDSPIRDYKTFCILESPTNILGFIVYFIINNIYYIVDVIYMHEDDILNVLLAEFFLFARKNNMGGIVIRYFGNDYFEKKLKEFNFRSRKKDEIKIIIYNFNNSFEQSYLFDKNNWHFLMGDKA